MRTLQKQYLLVAMHKITTHGNFEKKLYPRDFPKGVEIHVNEMEQK